MEGLLTFVVAIIGWLLLVVYPLGSHQCWMFLTEKEETFVIRSIDDDRADATEDIKFNLRDFLRPARDWNVFTYPMMFLSVLFFLYYGCPVPC
jgi:hypothetical protein